MKRTIWALCILLAVSTPGVRSQEGVRDLVAEASFQQGIKAHDEGRFGDAVAIFNALIEEYPEDGTLVYEAGLSLQGLGDLDGCADYARRSLELGSEALTYSLLGNCLDLNGKGTEAIEVYKRGLAEFSEAGILSYNLAVALLNQGMLEEGGAALQQAVMKTPKHASSHYALGLYYAEIGERFPATLALLRFLSLENRGERANLAAKSLIAVVDHGVTTSADSDTDVQINIAAPDGDGSGAANLMMALAAASRHIDKESESEVEKYVHQFQSLFAMMGESTSVGTETKQFVDKAYQPFFDEIFSRKLFEPFLYVTLVELQIPGTNEWLSAHEDETGRLLEHLRASH